MKKLFLFILICLPVIVTSQVDKFVFVTDPQTILPSTISKSVTIQAQNGSGIQEDVVETFDLFFQSSSPTGEFLNSSGNPVSNTMSKNTSNRTFYYRDSNLGEHNLSITFTGRDSHKSFTANQKITISNSLIENNNSNSNSSGNGNGSTESNSSSGTIKDFDFDVLIGKDKFSSVNNDVIFQAVTKNLKEISAQNIQYLWTLGDGNRKEGQIINHKYKYPGEYNVVLNASFADKHSSARIKVTIINPVFEINMIPGAIELINKSDGEINLGDWIILSGYQKFIIPKDTIVGKGKKIIFDRGTINISGQEIHLRDPDFKEVAFTNASSTNIQKVEFKIIDDKYVSNITNPKQTVTIQQDTKIVPKVSQKVTSKQEVVIQKNMKEEVKQDQLNLSATSTNMAIVYVAKSKTNILDSIFKLPTKTFKWLSNRINRQNQK